MIFFSFLINILRVLISKTKNVIWKYDINACLDFG